MFVDQAARHGMQMLAPSFSIDALVVFVVCCLACHAQVGQVGSWLILEEAILELLKHQSHIAYADVRVGPRPPLTCTCWHASSLA